MSIFFLLEELKISLACLQVVRVFQWTRFLHLVVRFVLRAPQSLELLAERFPWNCEERKKFCLLFIHGLLRPTGEGNCMAGKIKACAQRGQGYF